MNHVYRAVRCYKKDKSVFINTNLYNDILLGEILYSVSNQRLKTEIEKTKMYTPSAICITYDDLLFLKSLAYFKSLLLLVVE